MIASRALPGPPSFLLIIDHGGRRTSGAHGYGASRYGLDTRGLMLTLAASTAAVSGTHTWLVVQQNDRPDTSGHAITAEWDRRQISQVRARAHNAADHAMSLPPQTVTEPMRVARCRLPHRGLS